MYDDDWPPKPDPGSADAMERLKEDLEESRIEYEKMIPEVRTSICQFLSGILKDYGYVSTLFTNQNVVEGVLSLETVKNTLQKMYWNDGNSFQIAIASSGFTDPEFCKKLVLALQKAETQEDAISILRVALETEHLIPCLPIAYHPTPTSVGDEGPLKEILTALNTTSDEKAATVAEILAPELRQFLLFTESDPQAFYDATIEMPVRTKTKLDPVDPYADTLDSSAVPNSPLHEKISWIASFFEAEAVADFLIRLVEIVKTQLEENKTIFEKAFALKIVQDLQTFVLKFLGVKSGVDFYKYVKDRANQKVSDTMVVEAGAVAVNMVGGDFLGKVAGKLATKLISHLREQRYKKQRK